MNSVAKTCSVEGCNISAYGLSYCRIHYRKFKKYSNPLFGIFRPEPVRLCSIGGCGKPCIARGYCPKHYERYRVHDSPYIKLSSHPKPRTPCKAEGCTNRHHCKGYCQLHYTRYRKYGDPNTVLSTHPEPPKYCCVKECGAIHAALGFCEKHRWRFKKYGDPNKLKLTEENRGFKKSHPSVYNAWCQVKSRIYSKNNIGYKDYGGRGIKMCIGWTESIAKFYADMGDKPSPEHSIDRKNSKGHYSCGSCPECIQNDWPMNCRWATPQQQTWNRGKVSKNTSGFIGVTWDKLHSKWSAQIGHNYCNNRLDFYDDPEQAALAYDVAAIFFRGEFAVTNYL